MQLIIAIAIMLVMASSNQLLAQARKIGPDKSGDSLKNVRDSIELAAFEYPNWDAIEFDFLTSYYQQDGNNSAVTGGIGTEKLSDFGTQIIVKAPLKPRLTLNVNGGFDYYSSDSTDMIDPISSDDSAADFRGHLTIGLDHKIDQHQTFGGKVGGSIEYDYISLQAGLNYSKSSKNENTNFSIQEQSFFDQWKIIYPIELRGQGDLVPTKNRFSHNLAIGLNQVLTKRTQVSIQLEGTMMHGLLSTPFHRVYLQGEPQARVEQLPNARLKIPVGVRLNHFLTDWLIIRMHYRYYWDSWGMTAHTASLELPLKINRFFAVVPFYRYHEQTAVDYFGPYNTLSPRTEFYTADYDLSELSSHSIGLGVNYQPVSGIGTWKVPFLSNKKTLTLKSLDFKYSHYLRSTKMQADIFSFGLGFVIRKMPE